MAKKHTVEALAAMEPLELCAALGEEVEALFGRGGFTVEVRQEDFVVRLMIVEDRTKRPWVVYLPKSDEPDPFVWSESCPQVNKKKVTEFCVRVCKVASYLMFSV